VLSTGDADERGALLGEIVAACKVLGLAGAVIDGSVRAAAGIRDECFLAFVRFGPPSVGATRRVGTTQLPVS